ncbi:MAG: tetratricopeptide repeat protein [Nitrospirae bacterium]|nr:tetratricopeptide repeat protein [Nitrospirota bacterium]MBI5694153.1 tetratricopeptide repeat protein [Nitrospirota bacterium]
MTLSKIAVLPLILAFTATLLAWTEPVHARDGGRKVVHTSRKKSTKKSRRSSWKKKPAVRPPAHARPADPAAEAAALAASGEALLDGYDGTDNAMIDRAESEFRKALATEPGLVAGYVGLSKVAAYRGYAGGGSFDDRALTRALTLADRALELDPSSGAAYLQRGYILFYLESYGLARRQADRAEGLGVKASALYGELAIKSGDRTEARRMFKAALGEAGESRGRKADALDALGELAMADADYDTAVEMFKGASALRPDSSWEASNYGLALVQSGRYDEAIEILGYSLKKHDFPEARSNLALAYLKKGVFLHDSGETARAKRCYLNALEIDPGLKPVYRNLAAIYQAEGNDEGVRSLCRRLMKQDPDDPWARLTLEEMAGTVPPH